MTLTRFLAESSSDEESLLIMLDVASGVRAERELAITLKGGYGDALTQRYTQHRPALYTSPTRLSHTRYAPSSPLESAGGLRARLPAVTLGASHPPLRCLVDINA